MTEWTAVCHVIDIPVLGSRRVTRRQGLDVALFRNDRDDVFALLDRCPHRGGPLSQGIVFGGHVACPLHNWTIALDTGEASAPDAGCTPHFSVKVQDARVWLRSDELHNLGVDLLRPMAGPSCRGQTGT